MDDVEEMEDELTPEEVARRDALCMKISELLKDERLGDLINILGNVIAGTIVATYANEKYKLVVEYAKNVISTYADTYYKRHS